MLDRTTSFGRDAATIAVLSLAPAIGLGIGRFAYALVLPDMKDSLGWSYADAGFMNAANSAGYLLGALVAARLMRVVDGFAAVAAGAFVGVVGLALTAASGDFLALSACRFVLGLAAAITFVAGGAAAARISQRHGVRSSFLLGIFYAGPGVGILLSGSTVPPIMARLGPGSWPEAWIALAVLSLAMMPAFWRTRGGPQPAPPASTSTARPLRRMIPILLGYCAFGGGYIAYMTFMIAHVRDGGGSPMLQAAFWVTLGAATVLCPWIWSAVLTRLRHGFAMAALVTVTTIGATIPLLSSWFPALLLSAAIFGSAMFAVVASTTAFVRRNADPEHWARAIGHMTVAFSVGQIAGPIATGAITDRTGNLADGLWVSIGTLAFAAALAAIQRDIRTGA